MSTQIFSLLSEQIQAMVITDKLAPKPAVASLFKAKQYQKEVGDAGSANLNMQFATPTENETIMQQFSDLATGAAQVIEAPYDHFQATKYAIYEISNIGASGIDSVGIPKKGDYKVQFGAGAVTANDMLIVEGPTPEDTLYYKVVSVESDIATLDARLQYVSGATLTFKKCTATLKLTPDHYSCTSLVQGTFSLVASAFAAGSRIAIKYAPDLSDLYRYEIFAIAKSSAPVASDYATVSSAPGVIKIMDPLNQPNEYFTNAVTAVNDILQNEFANGTTYTFYIYAYDNEGTKNFSAPCTFEAETLPGVPQNVKKTTGANTVLIEVPAPATCGPNCSGYNVWRCEGSWTDANAVKLNVATITSAGDFSDSEGGANRVPAIGVGSVPVPSNGGAYIYKVEAVVDASEYDTANNNGLAGASKADYAQKTTFVVPAVDQNYTA